MSAAINRTYSSMDDERSARANTQPMSSAPVVRIIGWNDWQITAVKKILGFKNLTPNWDSYGSQPILNSVVCAAITFLSQASLENMPAPCVLPVSGGAIQFEWAKGRREIEVEVRPDGSLVYLKAVNGDPVEERPLRTAIEAGALLSWLSAG